MHIIDNIKQVSENKNYTAVSVGHLDHLAEHKLIHPISKQIIEGKTFLKEADKSHRYGSII